MTTTVADAIEQASPAQRQDLDAHLTSAIDLLPPPAREGIDVDEVRRPLARLVGQPVADIALAAWGAHDRIQLAWRRTVERPGSAESVTLHEHVIEQGQAVHVQVEALGRTFHVAEVAIDVELSVDAVEVLVRAGQIHAIGPGRVAAVVRVSVDGAPVVRSDPVEVAFPADSAARVSSTPIAPVAVL